MAKIATLLFVAFAFQGVLTHHTQEERNKEVQELLQDVQSISSDTLNIIQGVRDRQHIHSLYSQANEFAHNLHEVVYHLQQVVYKVKGEDQELVQEVVKSLSEIGHDVQRAIRNEPFELKNNLKTQVQRVAVEARKLAQVVRHEQDTERVNDDVEDVLSVLLDAVQQLQIRNKIQTWSEKEVKSVLQEVVDKVANVIQTVHFENEEGVEALSHHAHYLAHHVGEIVHKIQREMHNRDTKTQTILREVANKLSEIRTVLEQNTEEDLKVEELKKELKTNVHEVAVQVERLICFIYTDKQHEEHNLRDLVESVLARTIVAVKQLYRQIEVTVQHQQHQQQHRGQQRRDSSEEY